MKELGILVDETGKYMEFGTWVKYEDKDPNNYEQSHDTAFLKKVYPTTWFKNLNIPYNITKPFHGQLEVFAENGKMIINNWVTSDEKNALRLAMSIPNELSIQQILFLLKNKMKFKNHIGNGACIIDILKVHDDFNIINTFFDIDRFYTYIMEALISMFKEDYKQKVKSISQQGTFQRTY